MVERDNPPMALVVACLQDRGRHAEILLIPWSMVTAMMMRPPTQIPARAHLHPPGRAVAEHTHDRRAYQCADDRAATAEQRRATDHDSGDGVEVGVLAGEGDTAPMRPMISQPAIAQMTPAIV